jgi:hypothetical protein
MPEPKKAGRPSKKDELRRAIDEISIDPDMVDPHRILAAIAVDPKVSPATKIQACIALIDHPRKTAEPAPSVTSAASTDLAIPDDEITQRALQIMKTGTSR